MLAFSLWIELDVCTLSGSVYFCFLVSSTLSVVCLNNVLPTFVKNLPAVWETWAQSLGWEGPLEKGKATHSRTLAWKIPRTEEPGSLQSMGSQRLRHD